MYPQDRYIPDILLDETPSLASDGILAASIVYNIIYAISVALLVETSVNARQTR